MKVAELEEYGRQAQLTDAVKHFAQLAAASELAPAGSKRKQPDDASGLDSQAAKRQRQVRACTGPLGCLAVAASPSRCRR